MGVSSSTFPHKHCAPAARLQLELDPAFPLAPQAPSPQYGRSTARDIASQKDTGNPMCQGAEFPGGGDSL